MPSNHLILCHPFSSHRQSYLASRSFKMSRFFESSGQSMGVWASASVLPMNIQDWFSLVLTGWISLQSKGLSRVFSNNTVKNHQFFASGGQRIGVSASASILPKNIQGCSPLGWTGWISLQSKGLSRVFSNTTVHEFFGAQPSSQSNSHIHTWPQEKP